MKIKHIQDPWTDYNYRIDCEAVSLNENYHSINNAYDVDGYSDYVNKYIRWVNVNLPSRLKLMRKQECDE
jgi:hypothetical protein